MNFCAACIMLRNFSHGPLVKRAVVYIWQFPPPPPSPLKVREVSLTQVRPDSWPHRITEHRAWHNPRNIIGTTPGTLFWYKWSACPALTRSRLLILMVSSNNSWPYKIVHRIVQLGPKEIYWGGIAVGGLPTHKLDEIKDKFTWIVDKPNDQKREKVTSSSSLPTTTIPEQ